MGDDFKKNSAFHEESKQGFTGREFYRYFVLIWTKQRLIWFNLQRDGTRNGLSNIKETFAENLQLKISSSLRQRAFFKMLVSQFYMTVCDGWPK